MTTTADLTYVPDDDINRDATTDEFTPPRQPNNDDTRNKRPRQWTPEPQPATFDTLTEWGTKHFGEEWATNRQTMMDDLYNSVGASHPTLSKEFRERQTALRDMERRLQRDRVEPLGLELGELTSLARKRYGEGWHLNRRAAHREKEESQACMEYKQQWEHLVRSEKRSEMASNIMRHRDEAMLSEGYTWGQILRSSQPPIDAGDIETCTPAMSEVTEEGSELEDDAAPCNESEYAKQAREGPKSDPLEMLEWRAIVGDYDEERYELARWSMVWPERSEAENEECIHRFNEEGPEARLKRREMQAHFSLVQSQALGMLIELDELDENSPFNQESWLNKASERLTRVARQNHASDHLDELRGGDPCKLPELDEIKQMLAESRARRQQQQRKRRGGPQHERRQSRRLRQLPVEYAKSEDPDKIIRLANAARRRRGL